MLPLLKKKKLSNNPCELHLWGLCSSSSCGCIPPCCWNSQRNRDAAWNGLNTGLCWSQCVRFLRAAGVDQLCVAHAVVCALSFSGLLNVKMQSLKGFAGIVPLVLPGCLFYICFGFTSVMVGFSLIVYLMYGLSKMRLPHHSESLIIYC